MLSVIGFVWDLLISGIQSEIDKLMKSFFAGSKQKRLQEEQEKQQALIAQQLQELELEDAHRHGVLTQKGLVAKHQKQKEEEELAKKATENGDSSEPPTADLKEKNKLEIAKEGFEQVVNAIIRPPRASDYDISVLGPKRFRFLKRSIEREDFTVLNERGQELVCSYWQHAQSSEQETDDKRPVVIYLHGNASARMEVLPQLSFLLRLGVNVASLDCSGSGRSEGDYVSLGYWERNDVSCLISHLLCHYKASMGPIILWGRSMGAATALLYQDYPLGSLHNSIAAMICDSSFASLELLAQELVATARQQGIVVPGVVVSVAIQMITWSVQQKAKFDIHDLSPLDACKRAKEKQEKHEPGNDDEHEDLKLSNSTDDDDEKEETQVVEQPPKTATVPPAIFVTGEHDDFIKPHHSEQLHEAYPTDKKLMLQVPGDHNDPRPMSLFDTVQEFLLEHLGDDVMQHVLKDAPKDIDWKLPPWYHKKRYFESVDAEGDGADVGQEVVMDQLGMTKDRVEDLQGKVTNLLSTAGTNTEGSDGDKQ